MNAAPTAERCRSCGAILSRYRGNGDELCAPCARRAAEEERQHVLDPERLLYAVAGALFTARALEPERRVHLRAELSDQGIETDHVELFQAVQKLRRRGLEIDAEERKPGHRLVDWPYRFKRLRGPTARACFWRRQQKTLFRV